MTVFVAKELSQKMGTKLTIHKIDIGLLNRIIVDEVLLDDPAGKELFKVTRLSAKFDFLPLLKGKIVISSVQLFGFNIQLNKATPDAVPNFKFLLDAFASKDTVKTKSNIDLRINSILIRRGKLTYDVISEQETPGKFNSQHLKLHNIIANITLKALQNDSVNAAIKRLSVNEGSGFELKKLSLKLIANSKSMHINNFAIDLPGTSLKMDTIRLDYDSLAAFEQFADNVRFSFRTLPSHITLCDIAPFVPALSHFKEKVDFGMEVSGTVNQLKCSRLEVNTGKHFHLLGDVSLQDLSHPQDTYIFGNVSQLAVSNEGIGFLVRNLSNHYTGVPPLLTRLGDLSFRGEISGYFNDLVTYGLFHTKLGSIRTDLKLSSDKTKGLFSYSGSVQTETFALGKLLDNEKLGPVVFNLQVQGRHYPQQRPFIELKGLIAAIEYSHYTYENIALDGEYKDGGFHGSVAMDDLNGSIHANGSVNLTGQTPAFNFQAAIDKVRPHDLQMTDKYADAEFSAKLKANFSGGSIDQMAGEINVDSFYFAAPEKEYLLNNLRITAAHSGGNSQLKLTSEFLTANVEGSFHFRTLPASILRLLRRYLPSLITAPQSSVEDRNNFHFDLQLSNADLLSTVFDIPLTIHTPASLHGYVNDSLQRLRVEGYFPRLQYDHTLMESGLLICENPSDRFRVHARFTQLKKNGAVNVSLNTLANDDKLTTTVHWGNNAATTYSGELATVARFIRTTGERPLLKAVVDIEPTQIILNDTLWQVHPSQVVIDSGRVDVCNFHFSHRDRFIRIHGRLSDQPQDTIRVDLKDINVGYVFDIASIDDVNFQGDATGTAFASGVLKKPVLDTRLFIRHFSLNKALLGDMNIYGAWHDEQKGIYLDAHIQSGTRARSHVNGYIYPLKPKSGLDLRIDADSLNLKFIEFYAQDILQDLQGRGSGKIHFYGKFKALNLEGAAMTDASLKVGILNTSFALHDSLRLAPTGITFQHIHLSDFEGHTGTMDGYLHFQNFRNMNYRFDINVNNMLVMNTKESKDMPFYGTVYATGNALLTGNSRQGLDVNVGMTTNRNTVFTYTTGSVASAASNQFIQFVDKTPRRNRRDSVQFFNDYEQAQRLQEEKESAADIRLNILVDVTPDAQMKIIMDPLAGDYISGRGTGNIRTEFYNKGDVKMFGNYRISQGLYKFSLQEVIRKDFIIKEGSTLTFNGHPLDATLDIQAAYTVPSASLSDLIPEASTIVQQPNVRVNCMMNL
ncbi:MAG: translocation/assembly module TamB domain-containing protein, partial [Bacteroides sp.]